MKKWIISGMIGALLLGVTGCGQKVQDETVTIPALMEPVGVQVDVAQAQYSDIYVMETHSGVIVPYVEELQFTIDGKVGSVNVTLGDWVEEGQVLVSLSEEEIFERMEALQEEIADIQKTGEFIDRQRIADIEIAKEELKQLESNGNSKQTIQLKKVDVQKFEKILEQERELRQLEIQEKQREWKELWEKTQNNEIIAPFSGRVVYLQEIESGLNIQGYTTVVCLADDTRLWLESEFISEITVKNAYDIYAKIGEKEYDLEYVPFDKTEYFAKLLKAEEVNTRFVVDAPEGEIVSGQYGTVMVINSYLEDVLTIPVNALYQDAGGRYVYKMTDGKRVRCEVSVGRNNGIKAEITEGLEEGDLVYVKE